MIVLIFGIAMAGCGEPSSYEHEHPPEPAGRLDPSTVGIPPAQIDSIFSPFNRGVALMDQYRPQEAVKAFEEVVRIAPDWSAGRLNLGVALLNTQTESGYARAEQELSRLIGIDPSDAHARFALGMLFKHLNRAREAAREFEAVLAVDSGDADAHYQMGVLMTDRDPAAARRHFEQTLDQAPHHESACYRLVTLLREAGEIERARELMQRFRALKTAGAGVAAGMKYGEMGRYADILRAFSPEPSQGRDEPPDYADISADAQLNADNGAVPGMPAESSRMDAPAFGPGLAASDLEGRGELSVYIPGAGPDHVGALYRLQNGRFSIVPNSGIDGRNAVGAFFGDYDGDGDPDLYLTCDGPNRLYRNDAGRVSVSDAPSAGVSDAGRFTDVTAQTRTAGGQTLSVGAAWADADHDGDLDLYVANAAARSAAGLSAGAPNTLWRNNGDGTFTDVAPEARLEGGQAVTVGVLFFDMDDDRDLDICLLNSGSPNRIYLNDRVGQYTDATDRFPDLSDAAPSMGAVTADVDQNGRLDILLIRGPAPPRLFLNVDRGRFVEDRVFAERAAELGGSAGAMAADLDLDGDADIVLLDAGSKRSYAHRILMNAGMGQFAPPARLGSTRATPTARGALALDLNGDGVLEIVTARAGMRPEIWRAQTKPDGHWLTVVPLKSSEDDVRCPDAGVAGLGVEIKTGRSIQASQVTQSAGYLGSPPPQVHFGLGARVKADYVRLAWPDGVIQSELEVPANQRWGIVKIHRKPSSCPILFAWDGARFSFVTDFLGVGGVGFFLSPGVYGPPDPTERVLIPRDMIAPRDGRYLLRVAEPLEEVTWMDQLYLIAYDHPENIEIFPDERFGGVEPAPTGRPILLSRRIFPVSARASGGGDVLDRIRSVDRRYAEPPKDSRFVGYAHDHWIEVNFGDELRRLSPADTLVLCLHGWVEYTYSHVNYAAHQAGLAMSPPRIEIPDGKGGWKTAVADMGFPAGLPRMMTFDITALPFRADARMRIHTNMEIYWDQIFVGTETPAAAIRRRVLRPVSADLRYLGYPREYSPDGDDPTLYDYDRIDQGVPFKNMEGRFTRFGDVRDLLKDVDDRFVIMGRGEEIVLSFDAAGLPAIPPGWTRTFVLHSDGYCKDMDLYTAFPDSVDPMPYHNMTAYPPPRPPDGARRKHDDRVWHTRHVSNLE